MSDESVIRISGSATVAEVSNLHQAVTSAHAAEAEVVFDMSDARDIDASVVQLLLATRNASEKTSFSNAPNAITEVLAMCGVSDLTTGSPQAAELSSGHRRA